MRTVTATYEIALAAEDLDKDAAVTHAFSRRGLPQAVVGSLSAHPSSILKMRRATPLQHPHFTSPTRVCAWNAQASHPKCHELEPHPVRRGAFHGV